MSDACGANHERTRRGSDDVADSPERQRAGMAETA
ncbi:MAG: hypothetical protein JWM76_1729 [Pseudonocardiales bacterium]|nr:hypothetical protein [Pseudonocardiales bacterium]